MAASRSIIDWIDCGKVSAERDELLLKYFFDNGVLKSVIDSPSSFLVLGRKGAGKTAVFRYLSENAGSLIGSGNILVALSFEDYNWNVHSLLENKHKSESMIYKQSWRFVILVEALKAYKDWFSKGNQPCPKSLSTASAVLEKLFDTPAPSVATLIGKKILSLSGLKLPNGGLSLEDGSLGSIKLSAGEITFEQVNENKDLKATLSENVEHLITFLEKSLAKATAQCPTVYVCFDRVDEAWDEASFDSSRKVIAGLVGACDAVNSQYKGKIRPILFLREDIFDVLSINDSNKLRQDCGKLLHWSRPTLSGMLLRRINFFSSLAGEPSSADIDLLFDKPEMRQRSKPYSYIMRRTMMRPRDLISLFGRIIDAMKEKANDPFADDVPVFTKLECEAIYLAEPGYSEWLKKELIDEWKTQRPIIENLLTALQNGGSTNFKSQDLQSSLAQIGTLTQSSELISHLRFLFDNSVIGFKLGNSTEWRFKCFYPTQGFVESAEYRVHEGLVRALNLKEARATES